MLPFRFHLPRFPAPVPVQIVSCENVRRVRQPDGILQTQNLSAPPKSTAGKHYDFLSETVEDAFFVDLRSKKQKPPCFTWQRNGKMVTRPAVCKQSNRTTNHYHDTCKFPRALFISNRGKRFCGKVSIGLDKKKKRMYITSNFDRHEADFSAL